MVYMKSYFNNQSSVLFMACVVIGRCARVQAMAALCSGAVVVWIIARRLWLLERRLEF